MDKPLALFDIDGTMIPGTTYFRVLDAQLRDGLIKEVCVTKAYAALNAYKQGSISYEQLIESLLNVYAKGLRGLKAADVADSTNRILGSTADFYHYVQPTIEFLRKTHEVAIISGSPHFMADAVKQKFGIERIFSSTYKVVDGVVTGEVSDYLATRQQKHRAIQHLIMGFEFEGSVAFGDAEGDFEVLQSVEYPICIAPTNGLRQHAIKNGWVIIDSDSELNDNRVLQVVKDITLASK
jgi:HAD superfamily phosphoserine phosphatase-like hydrolase